MERAIKYLLKTYFEDYVLGLDNIDTSSLPVTISDLTLKEAKIKEGMEQDSSSPLQFIDGKIGKVQFRPVSFFGQVQVVASDVVLNLSFNPLNAVKKAIMPAVDDESDFYNQVPIDLQERLASIPKLQAADLQAAGATAAAAAVAASTANGSSSPSVVKPLREHCAESSDKRPRGSSRQAVCETCAIELETKNAKLSLCAPCAAKQRRCMVCGVGVSKDQGRAVSSSSTPGPRPGTSGIRVAPTMKPSGADQLPFEPALNGNQAFDSAGPGEEERLSLRPIFSTSVRSGSRSNPPGPHNSASGPQPRSISAGQPVTASSSKHEGSSSASTVAAVASLLPSSCSAEGAGRRASSPESSNNRGVLSFFRRWDISQCSSARLHDSRDYTHVEPALLPMSLMT